jgi:hypothetical protein
MSRRASASAVATVSLFYVSMSIKVARRATSGLSIPRRSLVNPLTHLAISVTFLAKILSLPRLRERTPAFQERGS